MRCLNPACGCPVNPDDEFCPNCGKPLEATTKGRRPQPEVMAETVLAKAAPAIVPVAAPTPAPVAGRADFAAPVRDEAAGASDCSDLEVLYNNNCVFVLNMQSTFDLEIRTQVDGIKDFFVEVRQSGRRLTRERPMMALKRGMKLPISLNYTPLNTSPGSVAFNIVVGYKLNGRHHIYAATRKHTLHSGKEDPRRVCDSLVIEVKNNIEQGHAGDIKVDQDFKELKNLLGEQDSLTLDKRFIDLINRLPIWTPLPLSECDEDALDQAGDASFNLRTVPPRLLLKSRMDGAEFQLCLQSRLQLGRARECELVTRVLDSAGLVDREASRVLSRFHACVEWRDQQAVLLDRGYYPGETQSRPSAAGVWLNGKRLVSGGEFVLRPGHHYQVSLGDPAQSGFALDIRLWMAGELPHPSGDCVSQLENLSSQPACVIVRPAGSPARGSVLVRQGLCLGWLDNQFGRGCLCKQRGGLRLSDEHGQSWLSVGQLIRAGQAEFQVLDPAVPKSE